MPQANFPDKPVYIVKKGVHIFLRSNFGSSHPRFSKVMNPSTQIDADTIEVMRKVVPVTPPVRSLKQESSDEFGRFCVGGHGQPAESCPYLLKKPVAAITAETGGSDEAGDTTWTEGHWYGNWSSSSSDNVASSSNGWIKNSWHDGGWQKWQEPEAAAKTSDTTEGDRLEVMLQSMPEFQALAAGIDGGGGGDVDQRQMPQDMIDLQASIKAGVPSQTKEYQDFRRAMEGTAEYKAAKEAKGYTAMRSLRVQWAEKKYEAKEKEFLKQETFDEEEADEGEYYTPDGIIEQEGGPGNPDNIIAAQNHLQWCLKKRGKWVKYIRSTGRVRFLHVKHKLSTKVNKRWQISTLEKAAGEATIAETDAAAKKLADEAAKKKLADDPAKKGSPGKQKKVSDAKLFSAEKLKKRVKSAKEACTTFQKNCGGEAQIHWRFTVPEVREVAEAEYYFKWGPLVFE